ncbi:MAG: FAD-binding protein [Saprospiraceae bacterium]|nr:FAD-binding protein [Saprospiraceae bacterium]MCF8251738.1 FAD-binding protein [Saprospiraceae bacterium]MCF8281120.1 FAD-binding protein [Bacteroidales bacterium]MCF8311792.1 FAD-binding protein [Saprospiraceae bacterium]MCF8441758.1 FAD-binding protein [Saprospiraceae bacterium]
MQSKLTHLQQSLEGELHFDSLMRSLYATDASVYKELPLAVAYPRTREDVKKLIAFATKNGTSLIPRTAGTSLGGQCVGTGIVVDVSKHWNKILEINVEERWVRVQPGVIRDELNVFLTKHGLFFGPVTATASRAMIGGMVGNNSCGATSIVHGTTRDHVLEIEAILSDGAEHVFKSLTEKQFMDRIAAPNSPPWGGLGGALYRQLFETLQLPENQANIRREYPKASIHRRNTGYAVDVLLDHKPFSPDGPDFNFCKLLTGSEGTLAFTTAIKLNVVPLPPPVPVVLCAHFTSLDESMEATLVAMQHRPDQCELVDKFTLDCTKDNLEQSKNRFFVQGDPAAVLMIEFRRTNLPEAEAVAQNLIENFIAAGMGYAFPVVTGKHTSQVWALRNAGLGVMSNIPGDAKPYSFVEDTAVALADLPAYIREFEAMMAGFGQQAVYYAHAGAGELHTKPVLNLKNADDVRQFREIAEASAKLVKKYNGSLSGEHGDGRVRAEFIPMMLGDANYQLLRSIKKTWDPHGIFNPGKITDAPPMDVSLRYEVGAKPPEIETVMDFSDAGGFLHMAEKCNGSGDCRRLDLSGGTMCPSYRATRDEKDTTRARANALREYLSVGSSTVGSWQSSLQSNSPQSAIHNPQPAIGEEEVERVLDLCLSCKGCTSECPSNVDMATMKAEFTHQYYQQHGVPFRAKFFGHIGRMNAVLSHFPRLANFFTNNPITGSLLKKIVGVAQQRSLPPLAKTTLRNWYKKQRHELQPNGVGKGKVFFFCDEFTDYYDAEIGIKALELLTRLGYEVEMPEHPQSGRAQLSKGLLPEAQKLARENVRIFSKLVSSETPLVGIEPSAILGFRDEYPRLVERADVAQAKKLGKNALLIDEFLAKEIQAGRISADLFTKGKRKVLLHGHCHQKALSSVDASAWVCGLPENYTVEVIPSGCCGMAGSFGYEKEHYEVSMKIGELVLFPAIRNTDCQSVAQGLPTNEGLHVGERESTDGPSVLLAAPGTSCRHQILDGTGRKALHPVEVLWEALAL